MEEFVNNWEAENKLTKQGAVYVRQAHAALLKAKGDRVPVDDYAKLVAGVFAVTGLPPRLAATSSRTANE